MMICPINIFVEEICATIWINFVEIYSALFHGNGMFIIILTKISNLFYVYILFHKQTSLVQTLPCSCYSHTLKVLLNICRAHFYFPKIFLQFYAGNIYFGMTLKIQTPQYLTSLHSKNKQVLLLMQNIKWGSSNRSSQSRWQSPFWWVDDFFYCLLYIIH